MVKLPFEGATTLVVADPAICVTKIIDVDVTDVVYIVVALVPLHTAMPELAFRGEPLVPCDVAM